MSDFHSTLSRRDFVKGIGIGGAGAVLLPGRTRPAPMPSHSLAGKTVRGTNTLTALLLR